MNSMQVRYFLMLCREKSFSKAAQKLYVTQPSFSQFIKKTEAEVNAELIDRSCSPIRLTEAGEAYYNACLQFAAVEEDMLSQIANLSSLKAGRLTLGTTPFRASTMLAKSIAAFKREYGRVEVNIIEGSVKQLKAAVLSGEAELAVCSGEFDEKSFHCEVLADERLYMAVRKDSPINERLCGRRLSRSDITENSLKLLKLKPCGIGEFADEPFISLLHGESISDKCAAFFCEAGISPKTVISTQNLYTAFAFVAEGVGSALIPDTLIKYGNLPNHSCYYAIDSVHALNRICLVTKRNRYLSRAAEEYSRILKQLIMSGTWRV